MSRISRRIAVKNIRAGIVFPVNGALMTAAGSAGNPGETRLRKTECRMVDHCQAIESILRIFNPAFYYNG